MRPLHLWVFLVDWPLWKQQSLTIGGRSPQSIDLSTYVKEKHFSRARLLGFLAFGFYSSSSSRSIYTPIELSVGSILLRRRRFGLGQSYHLFIKGKKISIWREKRILNSLKHLIYLNYSMRKSDSSYLHGKWAISGGNLLALRPPDAAFPSNSEQEIKNVCLWCCDIPLNGKSTLEVTF